jgi:catechol 2,3-dioxygenase-like lactoylglutathione lyase family enzyme
MATIRYIVKDVEAAIPFYRDLLGFKLVEQHGPAVAILEKDGLQFWVSGPPSSGARPMPDGRKPEAGGWNRMVIVVDDLAALVDTLKAAGVSFRNEIISGPGGQQILAEDPSGNPIELFQPA